MLKEAMLHSPLVGLAIVSMGIFMITFLVALARVFLRGAGAYDAVAALPFDGDNHADSDPTEHAHD